MADELAARLPPSLKDQLNKHTISSTTLPIPSSSSQFHGYIRLSHELQDMITVESLNFQDIIVVRLVSGEATDCTIYNCDWVSDDFDEVEDSEDGWEEEEGLFKVNSTPKLCFLANLDDLWHPNGSATILKRVIQKLPATLPTCNFPGGEIRYNPSATAIYIVDFIELLLRARLFRVGRDTTYPMFCTHSHLGQNIKKLVIDAEWFLGVPGFDEDSPLLHPWSISPWVNLFAKLFKHLSEVIVLVNENEVDMLIDKLFGAGYNVYNHPTFRKTRVVGGTGYEMVYMDEEAAALQNVDTSNEGPLQKLAEKAYCEIRPEDLFEAETRDNRDEDSDSDPVPLRILKLPPRVHNRHLFNHWISMTQDFYDNVTDKLIELGRYDAPGLLPTPVPKSGRPREFITLEDGTGMPEPSGRTPPKLRFHEGSVVNGLKLFRLPHRNVDDRYNFREMFRESE